MQAGREKKMSKLSFRARALDPSKQMPIYLAEELPDLPEYSAINRAVPQMPSGMEKEEESVTKFIDNITIKLNRYMIIARAFINSRVWLIKAFTLSRHMIPIN